MLSEPLRVVAEIAAVLERLHVSYLVGGSLASSMYGIPRSTQDIDLVSRLLPKHLVPFVQGLDALFHIDEEMVDRGVREQGFFDIIHRNTLYKADIFVPGLLQVQGRDLEFDYVERWARALGVEDLLQRIPAGVPGRLPLEVDGRLEQLANLSSWNSPCSKIQAL